MKKAWITFGVLVLLSIFISFGSGLDFLVGLFSIAAFIALIVAIVKTIRGTSGKSEDTVYLFGKEMTREEEQSLKMIDGEYRLLKSYIEEGDAERADDARKRVFEKVERHRYQYGTNDWLDSL